MRAGALDARPVPLGGRVVDGEDQRRAACPKKGICALKKGNMDKMQDSEILTKPPFSVYTR
jgi:hypothetical protein